MSSPTIPDSECSDGKVKLAFALRNAGVADHHLIGLMEAIPRDLFVPEVFRNHAFDDVALPIGMGQTISQISVVAQMTEALEIGERDKVLEIGTGSGYQTVILSHLCRRVYSIERHTDLLASAQGRFDQLRRANITCVVGDGSLGWKAQAPFDRIIVTAAAEDIPPLLVEQLAIGGIMIVPVGDEYAGQKLLKIHKTAEGLDVQELKDVRFVPLVAGAVE